MSEHVLKSAAISREEEFALRPDAEARATLAESLGIRAVRKLSFAGRIMPEGTSDLRLEGDLGATVVQDCVVTGDPVTTRIDETVQRLYLKDFVEPEGDEAEMPEDDTAEALPADIDLNAVMAEALALALPPWPRADGVEPIDLTVTEPGKAPMTDDDAKPFAGLKGLLKDDDASDE